MATNVNLDGACPFAVLAGSAITSTGATVLNGELGISPNGASSVTGFPPAIVNGATHFADAIALQAQIDLTDAIIQANLLPVDANLTGQVLGSGGTVLTLTPGVYKFDSSAQLNGNLILDGAGDYVFLIGSTLTTASASSITLINGATANQVYWVVGSSATLGTTTAFQGNILASASITVTTGATVQGNLLAKTAVTLDSNIINSQACPIACPVITVNPPVLPNGQVGVAYSQTVSQVGGTPPIVFSVSSGTLPAGLSLNSATGDITGVPLTAGTSIFTITATDVNGCLGFTEYMITIASVGCPIITLSPLTLPNGLIGSPYNQVITESGGTPPDSFAITFGSLPNGLVLSAGGTISGTPTTAGLFNFTVTVTDDNECQGALNYSVNILAECPLITLLPSTLPNGRLRSSYNQTISAPAGTPPVTFLVTAGSLPSGLNLDPVTGIISGTATTRGTFEFTITATDINGCMGSQQYSIYIQAARSGTKARAAVAPAARICVGRRRDYNNNNKLLPCPERITFGGYTYILSSEDEFKCCYNRLDNNNNTITR